MPKSNAPPVPALHEVRVVAPGLGKYMEGSVGDLWKRPDLTPRDRSIVTLAVLIGRNHTSEMTMASVGSAVQAACRSAREDALARGGGGDLIAAMRRLGQPVEASADVSPGDEGKRFSMHSFGAVFVEVTVDPDLGETRVRRIVGAYGAGRIVNPKTTRSQCIGGMIGGIGMALMEHSVVDPRNGRVPNANFAEYAVPVHADAPPVMDVVFVEEHDPYVNPLRVKGVGEIAMVGVAPAITNAIFHATDKRIRELPVTPDKLL
jgi:xanthine dehydrogenase YagR molybdenum-binding subunit